MFYTNYSIMLSYCHLSVKLFGSTAVLYYIYFADKVDEAVEWFVPK